MRTLPTDLPRGLQRPAAAAPLPRPGRPPVDRSHTRRRPARRARRHQMAHSSQAARGFAAADGTLSQRIGIAKLHHDDCQRQPARSWMPIAASSGGSTCVAVAWLLAKLVASDSPEHPRLGECVSRGGSAASGPARGISCTGDHRLAPCKAEARVQIRRGTRHGRTSEARNDAQAPLPRVQPPRGWSSARSSGRSAPSARGRRERTERGRSSPMTSLGSAGRSI